MAALLKIVPAHGALTTAAMIARLTRAVDATLSRQTQRRPALVCRWRQDDAGHLSCCWEYAAPDIAVPPH
jgi:hypothetical protein